MKGKNGQVCDLLQFYVYSKQHPNLLKSLLKMNTITQMSGKPATLIFTITNAYLLQGNLYLYQFLERAKNGLKVFPNCVQTLLSNISIDSLQNLISLLKVILYLI